MTKDSKQYSVLPKIFGVKFKCILYNDTVCAPCGNGYYSRKGSKYCKKCRSCPHDYHVVKTCTATRNTKCKQCKEGRYYSEYKMKCMKCHGCRPGYYVKAKCSKTLNTQCRRCPYGTFTDSYGMNMKCKPCKACQYLEDIIKPCSRKNDNICGNCKQGYFRLTATWNCGRCSECYRDTPDYTVEVTECARKSNGSNRVCLPVVNPPIPYNETDYQYIPETEHIKGQADTISIDEIQYELPVLLKGLIGVACFIVFLAFLSIIIMCCVHRHKMKLIKKSPMINMSKRSSVINTENWINQHTNIGTSYKANSVPFLSGSCPDFEYRIRSNTFSNNICNESDDFAPQKHCLTVHDSNISNTWDNSEIIDKYDSSLELSDKTKGSSSFNDINNTIILSSGNVRPKDTNQNYI
ncbi:tumor necrosis factor receptor superfamily member 3-like isoform X2 [Mytilus trossulus]